MRIGDYNHRLNYYDLQAGKKITQQKDENSEKLNKESVITEEKSNDDQEAMVNTIEESEKSEYEVSLQDRIEQKDEEGKQLISELNKLNRFFDDEDDSECTSANEKVIKEFKRKQKAEKIGSKIARGENITPSERAYLQQRHPELLDKSYKINRARKEAEMRIRRAKTTQEARQIIMNARLSGIMISRNSLNDTIGESGMTGKVIGSAVDKMDTDTKRDIKKKEQKKNEDLKRRKKKQTIDKLNKLI